MAHQVMRSTDKGVFVLDTHVWIRAVSDPQRLCARVYRFIRNPSLYESNLVSAIPVWKGALLAEKGRISPKLGTKQWIQAASSAIQKLKVMPASAEIALQAAQMDIPHRDPADRIIMATAKQQNATLMKKDQTLSASWIVTTLW